MIGDNDLRDDLEELNENAKELDGENDVPLSELFSPTFMHKYTELKSIERFFEESECSTKKGIDGIPDDLSDDYVSEHTVFSDFDSMLKKARDEWIAEQMQL